MGCKRGTILWLFCTPIKFRHSHLNLLECMAGTTGLEPATSDVTGRRSNQLNYVPALSLGIIHATTPTPSVQKPMTLHPRDTMEP